MGIINQIKEKAKIAQKTIVLPEATDERVLKAAQDIVKEGLAKVVLVGNAETLNAEAAKVGADLEGAIIIDPNTFENIDRRLCGEISRKKS
jgi:phosphate acetyltransferase